MPPVNASPRACTAALPTHWGRFRASSCRPAPSQPHARENLPARPRIRIATVEDLVEKINSCLPRRHAFRVRADGSGTVEGTIKVWCYIPGEGLGHRMIAVDSNTTARSVVEKLLAVVPYLKCLYQFPEFFEVCELHRSRRDTVLLHENCPLRMMLLWAEDKLQCAFGEHHDDVPPLAGFIVRISRVMKQAHLEGKLRQETNTASSGSGTGRGRLSRKYHSSLRSLRSPSSPLSPHSPNSPLSPHFATSPRSPQSPLSPLSPSSPWSPQSTSSMKMLQPSSPRSPVSPFSAELQATLARSVRSMPRAPRAVSSRTTDPRHHHRVMRRDHTGKVLVHSFYYY